MTDGELPVDPLDAAHRGMGEHGRVWVPILVHTHTIDYYTDSAAAKAWRDQRPGVDWAEACRDDLDVAFNATVKMRWPHGYPTDGDLTTDPFEVMAEHGFHLLDLHRRDGLWWAYLLVDGLPDPVVGWNGATAADAVGVAVRLALRQQGGG